MKLRLLVDEVSYSRRREMLDCWDVLLQVELLPSNGLYLLPNWASDTRVVCKERMVGAYMLCNESFSCRTRVQSHNKGKEVDVQILDLDQ